MYNKKFCDSHINDIHITPSQFEEIKKDYLSKRENKYCLYTKYYKKYKIQKDLFLEILEVLKLESKHIKKQPPNRIKRKNNPYSFHDKHPQSYKIKGMYHNGYKTSEFQKNKNHHHYSHQISFN